MVDWTSSMAETARDLRREGMSCGLIAQRLGVSRNAVIGKLNRMGVPSPREPGGHGGPGTRIQLGKREAPETPRGPKAVKLKDDLAPTIKASAAGLDAERLAEDISLAQLGGFACHFPVSGHQVAADEHRFCGLPVADRDAGELKLNRRYCAHHAARARARDGQAGV
ncbi:GcrA family cell cycle regulator [Georhizobium profundi]|nr:GcrA family cell cycle regulator [Georhizobium profundi]